LNATIVSITYKPQNIEPPTNAFLRVPLETAELVAGYGIKGDAKGGNPKRQLNIMSVETMRELEGEGYNIAPGALGEQMVIEGIDVRDLPIGSQLKLGAEALVEVLSLRNGCARFEAYQGKPRASGRIGILVRVVEGGVIHVGDTVTAQAAEIHSVD
jgi:molybdopterin adenylyltransferase